MPVLYDPTIDERIRRESAVLKEIIGKELFRRGLRINVNASWIDDRRCHVRDGGVGTRQGMARVGSHGS